MRLAEVDRRQNHISQVDPNHPLLPIALDCLKDEDIERPSAQQLCERVASLKERPEYSNSVAAAQEESQQLRQQLQQLQQVHREESQQKDRQLEQMREQLQELQQSSGELEKIRQQLESQQLKLQLQQRESGEKDKQLEQLRQQLQQLQKESAREREEKETQIGQMGQQLHQLQENLTKERKENKRKLQQYLAFYREAAEQITTRDARESQLNQQVESLELERAKLEKRLHELEEQLLMWEGQAGEPQWSEGGKAPFADRRRRDAVVDGNRAYFLDGNGQVWTYDVSNRCWSQLSIAPYFGSSLAILNGLLTTVGGDLTNKLMSLTTKGNWMEKLPPMPTRRKYATSVCTETALIVVGGTGGKYNRDLTTVEVLNIETHEWFTAVNLPEPLYSCSATICGDRLYMLGGIRNTFPSKSVYSCSVSTLLWLSNGSDGGTGVWNKLADLPVRESTCVTFCEELLAIGGEDSDNNTTAAVYMYSPSSNSWNFISHINRARRCPFAAVLPDNQVIVVGGEVDSDGTLTNSVEFCSLV